MDDVEVSPLKLVEPKVKWRHRKRVILCPWRMDGRKSRHIWVAVAVPWVAGRIQKDTVAICAQCLDQGVDTNADTIEYRQRTVREYGDLEGSHRSNQFTREPVRVDRQRRQPNSVEIGAVPRGSGGNRANHALCIFESLPDKRRATCWLLQG